MGFYKLIRCNSIDDALRDNSKLLCEGGLFDIEKIIISENKALSAFIKEKTAEYAGIFLGPDIYEAGMAMHKLLGYFPKAQEILEKRKLVFDYNLTLPIVEIIESIMSTPEDYERYKYFMSYLEDDDGKTNSVKLFSLAGKLANVLGSYVLNSPRALNNWAEGKMNCSGSSKSAEYERFEAEIYSRLFLREGSCLVNIHELVKSIVDSEADVKHNVRVFIFGTSFASKTTLDFIKYFSRYAEIYHFAVIPDFDMGTGMPQCRMNQILAKFAFGSLLKLSGEPIEHEKHYKNVSAEKSMLSQMKGELIGDSPPTAAQALPEDDDSLNIISVIGKQREVDVLYDKLLLLLDKGGLSVNDVLVLAPDISEYKQHIESVFSSGPLSPAYNILAADDGSDNEYVSLLLDLLTLPGSRFSRKELFPVLENCAFSPFARVGEDERKVFIKIFEQLNIKWGVDAEHRQNLGAGNFKGSSFEQAAERLLYGIVCGDEEGLIFNGSAALDTQSAFSKDVIALFIQTLRCLYSDLYFLNKVEATLKDWADILKSIIENYFSKDDDKKLSRLLEGIYDLSETRLSLSNPDKTFTFDIVKEYLKLKLNPTIKGYSGSSSGGILFTDLQAGSRIKREAVFILGMNENGFPKRTPQSPFDLKIDFIKADDLYKRVEERYSGNRDFVLQALAANVEDIQLASIHLAIINCGSRLYLFYHGKDENNLNELYPSIVIQEIMSRAAAFYGLSKDETHRLLLEEHPMHPFSRSYFIQGEETGKRKLFTYSEENYKNAQSFYSYSGEAEEAPSDLSLDEEALEEAEDVVMLHELISSIKNPVKLYLNKTLDIYINEEGSSEDDIYEKIALNPLDDYMLNTELLEKSGGDSNDPFKRRLATSEITDSMLSKKLEIDFEFKINLAKEGLGANADLRRLSISFADKDYSDEHVIQRAVKAVDGVHVYGSIPGFRMIGDRPVLFRYIKDGKAKKHYYKAAAELMAAKALGADIADSFMVLDASYKLSERPLNISKEAAERFLRALIEHSKIAKKMLLPFDIEIIAAINFDKLIKDTSATDISSLLVENRNEVIDELNRMINAKASGSHYNNSEMKEAYSAGQISVEGKEDEICSFIEHVYFPIKEALCE